MDREEKLIVLEEEVKYSEYQYGEMEHQAVNNQVLIDTRRDLVGRVQSVSFRLDEIEKLTNPDTVLLGSSPGGKDSVPGCSTILAPNVTSTPAKRPSGVLVKPRDIKILELEALQGLDSAAMLQMFFEQVEHCTDDSEARLEVAKSRVDNEMAVMIHTAQKQGEIKKWDELKQYLTQEFGVELNFDQAWKQNNSINYDWMSSPQYFVHKFKCQYAAIRGTFHSEVFPDRDRLLKIKLLQGFPRGSRDLLKVFLDDNIPLNQFLGHVENERTMLLKTQVAVNSVPFSLTKTGGSSQNLGDAQSETSVSMKSEDSLAELTNRLKYCNSRLASHLPRDQR